MQPKPRRWRHLQQVKLTGALRAGQTVKCPKCSGYGDLVVDPAGGRAECTMCRGHGWIRTK